MRWTDCRKFMKGTWIIQITKAVKEAAYLGEPSVHTCLWGFELLSVNSAMI